MHRLRLRSWCLIREFDAEIPLAVEGKASLQKHVLVYGLLDDATSDGHLDYSSAIGRLILPEQDLCSERALFPLNNPFGQGLLLERSNHPVALLLVFSHHQLQLRSSDFPGAIRQIFPTCIAQLRPIL